MRVVTGLTVFSLLFLCMLQYTHMHSHGKVYAVKVCYPGGTASCMHRHYYVMWHTYNNILAGNNHVVRYNA